MTFVRLLLAVFFCQVSFCYGIETTTTLVPTPTSTPTSVANQAVQNETVRNLNTTVKSNLNTTVKSNLNTTVKNNFNATAKSILNATAKRIFNNTLKSNQNATAKRIFNTTLKSNQNTTAKSIVNTTDKINLNLTKKLNLTAPTPSQKMDEIVKKIDTSVSEIEKTTRKSWLMICVIIFVISLYCIYKISSTIQKMRQRKIERDEEQRLVLPLPSASSPKNLLKKSTSTGFFAPPEQTIRAKSPENSNLRQRFVQNVETKQWHV